MVDNCACAYCNEDTKTVTHAFIEYPNTIRIWQDVESWVKRKLNKYLKISDIEKIFGNCENNRVIDMIISATIKAIYQKRRTGKR